MFLLTGTTKIRVSEYLHDALHTHIIEKLRANNDVVTAIIEGFQQADQVLVDRANREGKWKDGSTAAVAIIRGSTLYVANLGDTEACLVSVDGYASGQMSFVGF